MRPIETLLILVNLLTFFVLAVSLPHVVRGMRYLAPSTLLLAVAQVLVEGARWQMVPAYALTGLLFLVGLRQHRAPTGEPATNRLFTRLTVGLGLLGLAVSIVLPLVLPVFRFAQPNGPYAIGTLSYHWVDASRPEIFSAEPHAQLPKVPGQVVRLIAIDGAS